MNEQETLADSFIIIIKVSNNEILRLSQLSTTTRNANGWYDWF